MEDTTRKMTQMQYKPSVAVLSCAVCPKGLPVISYTARKTVAALCQLRSHKCLYSHVAAFVGWLVGVSSSDIKPVCPTRSPKKYSVAEENLQDKSTLFAGF